MSEWEEIGTLGYLRRSDGWWRVVVVVLPNGARDMLFKRSNWIAVALSRVLKRVSLLTINPPQS